MPGDTLMPRMIEGHKHLFLHPYNETTWDDQVLHEPLTLRTARAIASATATLLAGLTSERDLGTEGAVARYRGRTGGEPAPANRSSFRLAIKAGVRMYMGGDVGVFAHGRSARDMELMVARGMTLAQVLIAATWAMRASSGSTGN